MTAKKLCCVESADVIVPFHISHIFHISTQGQRQCQDFMVSVSTFDTAMKSEEASRLMQGTGKKLSISTDIINNMEQFTIQYICNDKESN